LPGLEEVRTLVPRPEVLRGRLSSRRFYHRLRMMSSGLLDSLPRFGRAVSWGAAAALAAWGGAAYPGDGPGSDAPHHREDRDSSRSPRVRADETKDAQLCLAIDRGLGFL